MDAEIAAPERRFNRRRVLIALLLGLIGVGLLAIGLLVFIIASGQKAFLTFGPLLFANVPVPPLPPGISAGMLSDADHIVITGGGFQTCDELLHGILGQGIYSLLYCH